MADSAFMNSYLAHICTGYSFSTVLKRGFAVLCFLLVLVSMLSEAEASSRQNLKANQHYIEGVIQYAFEKDAISAGLPKSVIKQMTDIFAWDIDFAKDVERYDQFRVIYEVDPTETPFIIAAQIVVQGQTYSTVRYTTHKGKPSYYTPEGYSTKKAFLRMPVEYARISSRFDPYRRHPILNKIRAHKGVDYAARQGTPVRATGDGRITWMDRKGGYGNAVIIDHGDKITTLYAHLSHFNSNLKNGAHVKQGQVIGYIGMTGLATGPHLHYEFRIADIHKDPLNVKLEHTYPIHVRERLRFRTEANQKLALLSLYAMRFASSEE